MTILVEHKNRNARGLRAFDIPNHSQLKQVIMKTTSNVANIPHWQNLSLENLKGEIWKDVSSYEGIYQISNLGRFKSLSRVKNHPNGGKSKIKTRIIRQAPSRGYMTVALCRNGKNKTAKVHRLVAYAFMNKTDDYVNHIDLDKTNNAAENLEWCSIRENTSHFFKNIKTKSKYTGVTKRSDKSEKWISAIHIDGKRNFLGEFDKEIDAGIAYQKALKELKKKR